MATLFFVSNPISRTHTFTIASLRTPPFRSSPALLHAGSGCRRTRVSTVTTRAGPSTSSVAFAIALPLSLLAVTVFTALRIGDKLDQDFYEEMAMNEAIMEVDEDEDDEDNDDDVGTYLQEEPALPRGRNRPKREAEMSGDRIAVDRSADLQSE